MKKTVLPLLSILSLALAAQASPTWETGNYDPATWTASSGNLIAGVSATDGLSYYNEGGKTMAQNLAGGSADAMSALTDGVVPGTSMDYNKVVGIMGGTLTWTLASAANLTSLRIFTRWGDGGRDGIYTRSLAVLYAGDTEYTVLDTVPRADVGRGDNGTSGHLYAFLTDPDGVLAENIVGIQLTFSSSQDNNGTGYVEIEALGVPAAAVWHTINLNSVSAWRATFGGLIGSCAGGTSADVYFAYGTDASTLVPALVASDVAEGDSYAVPELTGLTPSTTYAYATYCVSDLGVQSTTITGTFTTPAEIPVVATVTPMYTGTAKAAVQAAVANLGEEGSSASLYFAMGTDANALVPALVGSNLAAGATVDLPFGSLDPSTTYSYACYAVNNLGNRSATVTGTFTTTDGSTPTWLGLVSENWSDGMNWDSETAPSPDTTYATIILDYPYGCHPPANLDIQGLGIRNLQIVSDRNYEFTVSGLPFTCYGISGTGSGTASATFLNDIVARDGGWNSFRVGIRNTQTVRLMGTLSSPDEGITIMSSEQGGTVVLGGENTFSGRLESHVGSLRFYSDANLGTVPAEVPDKASLQQNFGLFVILSQPDRNLNVVTLPATRRLKGNLRFTDGTEGDFKLALDENLSIDDTGSTIKHLLLDGTVLASSASEFSDQAKIRISGNIIAKLGPSFQAPASRGLRTFNSTIDFAGQSPAGVLENYNHGLNGAPNFINSDRTTESVIANTIRLGYDYNTYFFGGPGDIRVEGDITQDAGRHFHKSGQGRLTLAGESLTWSNSTDFRGDTTLDYRTHNTAKLGNPAITMGAGDLHIVGNATSPTACELSQITLGDGLVTLSTEGGAGLSLAPSKISSFSRDRAIDFQLDANTSLAFTDTTFANNATLGALNAGATWNHGSAFAYLNADGTVGPLPIASLDATLANGTIWSIPSGATSILDGTTHTPVGLFVNGDSGDATVTLSGTIDIQSDGSACPILVSSACGGDVTFTGGTIKSQNYNRGIMLHNWNRNGILRISSLLPETNDNNFMIAGPGTTLIDNDSNSFYYGPHLYGGGIVRFTSIADKGQRSALGKGNNDYGNINVGHGCTFEYVGTTSEGHSSNRRFTLYGDVTLKANGEGPLTLTGSTAIGGGFATSRLILDGEGEGVIEGAVSPGRLGSVVKRGTGTWTMASTESSYEYPTEVEEGVLRVTGALPSSVVVKQGGTLSLAEGAVVKRHFETSGTVRFEIDPDAAEHTPVKVWGHATLGGVLDIRGKLAAPTVVLTAENGIDGDFSSILTSAQVKVVGNDVIVNPSLPLVILIQ